MTGIDREQTTADEAAQPAGSEGHGSVGGAEPVAGRSHGGGELQQDPTEELVAVRALILQAYPDTVSEMLTGDSVDALLASVPAARQAHARVAAEIHDRTPTPVPAGGARRSAVDIETLSPELKIRVGLTALARS